LLEKKKASWEYRDTQHQKEKREHQRAGSEDLLEAEVVEPSFVGRKGVISRKMGKMLPGRKRTGSWIAY